MSKEAMKLALEALETERENYQDWDKQDGAPEYIYEAITALREALAEHPAQGCNYCNHALYAGIKCKHCGRVTEQAAIKRDLTPEQPAQQERVTVLPDGSAFAVMSYPLPKDHWLYADRQYNDGEYEPVELGKPVLTHELRDAVVSAVRYAIRGATNCGKEVDFDPDALVQNAVYALCGPFTSPPAQPSKPN